jgi:hypothetical protein
MSLRQYARAGIALAAAYAVALQAILLAFSVPVAAAGAAILPICSAASGHSAPTGHPTGHPSGHGQDCLDACLTGCCSGAPVCPSPAAAAMAAPVVVQTMAPALGVSRRLAERVDHAHRSRAPPAGA